MTPNDIEVLIHCHTSPVSHPRKDAPAVRGALQSLEVNELIEEQDDGIYHTTGRGRAHLAQLCATAFPATRFVNSHNEIIEL